MEVQMDGKIDGSLMNQMAGAPHSSSVPQMSTWRT